MKIISYIVKICRYITRKNDKINLNNYFVGALEDDIKKLQQAGGVVRRLTQEQKQQVYELWGRGVDVTTHELIYSATGKFMPEYCPLTHFREVIEPVINNQEMVPAWGDKNLFEKMFPDVKFPKTIVRNINGMYYDQSYNLINIETAIELAKTLDKSIIKPTVGSFCGNGVSLLHKEDDIQSVFQSYQKNFAVQELLIQHPSMAKFNTSSVNVIRYNTLFYEGDVHPLSATLRIGAAGAINDNSILDDGRGMIVVNINSQGEVDEKGYYSNGERVSASHNGVLLKGNKIPNFSLITETVIRMHRQMAHFAFIGFDVAIDEEANPVIMEYNVYAPGVIYYQYTSGPLFGPFTRKIANQFKRRV